METDRIREKKGGRREEDMKMTRDKIEAKMRDIFARNVWNQEVER